MKQILHDLGSGQVSVAEVPVPTIAPGHLLIASEYSAISPGTERMLLEFGKAGLIDKARKQPEKVRQVLHKARTDGWMNTWNAVNRRLKEPMPLGYSNAGRVLECGDGVTRFSTGDRVVSNGPHAEVVHVPAALCTGIPEGVRSEDAAFTVIASVGLQGIRLLKPDLGERIVVIGLGLIGLITVQLLRGCGCRVLGVDLSSERCAKARNFGAQTVDLSLEEDLLSAASVFSEYKGVDGVLITASTSSNDPLRHAAEIARQRARIVLVGVSGMTLDRSLFYRKELTFQVSCSYGPGRYDPDYEEKGRDYPFGLVRWTEQRNMAAVLVEMDRQALNVRDLVSAVVPFNQAMEAYRAVENGSSLGILLSYSESTTEKPVINLPNIQTGISHSSRTEGTHRKPALAVIGAGNYASQVLLPVLSKVDADVRTIVSRNGTKAADLGKRYGIQNVVTDPSVVFDDPGLDGVIIATRHDSHGELTLKALDAQKHVYVEKPLCLTLKELEAIETSLGQNIDRQPLLMVGFNRRFSAHGITMKRLLQQVREPMAITYTVNAGWIDPQHWTQDPEAGGGRILGEAIHFVDFCRFLAGSRLDTIHVECMETGQGQPRDVVILVLRFDNGSIASIQYFANGHKKFPKEKVEVFVSGRILMLENFRSLKGAGWPSFRGPSSWHSDKGHRSALMAFIEGIREGKDSFPLAEILEVNRKMLEL